MTVLSFRVKAWLSFAGSVLALVFLLFVTGTYYIDRLQKANVDAAILLAQEQARQLRRDILELLAGQEGGMSNPGFRAGARRVTSVAVRLNRNIEWAMIMDADGNRVIQTARNGEQVLKALPEGSSAMDFPLPDGAKGQVVVESKEKGATEIREPIQQDGRRMGEIRFKLADTQTFQAIQSTSRQISEALVVGSVLFLFFLVVVFLVLWRLFSKQIRLTQKNAELDRMAYVGTLASGLAHEIRNPLSAMSVNLEVLQEEIAVAGGGEQAGALASRVQREVHQLSDTLTSFLDFALPQKDSFTRFSLRGLVEELAELHGEEMRQAGISFELKAPPGGETMLEGDRRLIHQALRNVLVNAIQVLRGSVKKSLQATIERRPKGVLRLIFCDSGPGVSPENLEKIFVVFFSTRRGGSGFGLAVARKVVEEHGGRIWAENNQGSLGASFIVELPVEQHS